jgi:hypothetical protein
MEKLLKDAKSKLRLTFESRWEAQKRIFEDFPTSHDPAEFKLAFRFIGEHLICFYEIYDDVEQTVEFVTNSDLSRWKTSFDELWPEVLDNTKTPHFFTKIIDGHYVWQPEENDGTAVSAIMRRPDWQLKGTPTFFPTSNSQMTVFAAEAMEKDKLFDFVHKEVLAFPPFLLQDGEEGWHNNIGVPADTRFGAWLSKVQHKFFRRIYSEQRTIFASKHMDFFTAPYEIHEDVDGHLFSSSTIFEGLDTIWLPGVDQIKLRKANQRFDQPIYENPLTDSSDKDDDLVTLTWDEFVSSFEHRLEVAEYYPPRYKFSGFLEAELKPILAGAVLAHRCSCRGVTGEINGFGFPCLIENQVVKIPQLKVRCVPARALNYEKFDDDGKSYLASDNISSGSVGPHIGVYLEYLDAKSGTFKTVDNKLLARWQVSFNSAATSATDAAPPVRFTSVLWHNNDIVWKTEGGAEHNIGSLIKKPNFSVNGDLVMWAVNEVDIYAFGTNTNFLESEIPEDIVKNSSFPPFPLLWLEAEKCFEAWTPPADNPMHSWIKGLQNQYLRWMYDEQYESVKGTPSSLMRCELHQITNGSSFLATSITADNDYYHFPIVDQINIFNSINGAASHSLIARLCWDDFMALFGDSHVESIKSYPRQILFRGLMEEEALKESTKAKYKKNIRKCICCS